MSEASDDVLYQRGEDAGSDTWDDTVLIKAYDNAVSAMKAKFVEQHPELTVPASQSTTSTKKKRNKQKLKAKKKKNPISQTSWKVGDNCKAIYTEDGEIYTAQILGLNDDNKTCIVQYTEYGNEEEQALDELLPPSRDASSAEIMTDTTSETETVKRQVKGKRHSKKHSSSDGQKPKMGPPRWPWPSSSFPPGAPTPFQQPFPPFAPPSNFMGHPGFGIQSAYPHVPPPPLPPPPPPLPLFNGQNSENDSEALYTMLMSWYMSGYHTGYYQGMKNSSKASSRTSPYMPHR